VEGVADVVEVTTSSSSTCALRSDGTVLCWGGNFAGVLGNGTRASNPEPTAVVGLHDAVALYGGPDAVCVRRRATPGSATPVACWGQVRDPTPALDPPVDLLLPLTFTALGTVRQIYLNQQSVCIRGDLPGEPAGMYCWGYNVSGQLGNGTNDNAWTPTRVLGLDEGRDLRLGAAVGCAVDGRGAVYCWGYNERGTLGDGTTIASLRPVRVTRPR